MTTANDMYPTVTLEEAEMLFDWLRDYAGIAPNDIAEALNLPVVYIDQLSKSEILYVALNWLFFRIDDFVPDAWPPGTTELTWADLPGWVNELYQRATECEAL